ncbi:MAG: T9SS type A sorting domain-containing protein, partial [Gemmatimonadetes bacterium]|nr:T9SS type A sorting domain-containing protein [Gemmatimonadota bacterium]
SGTLKNVAFKYLLQAVADTAFAFECAAPGPGGENNRDVFLNDSLFSTVNPIVLDTGYFNDCLGVTGVNDLAALVGDRMLEAGRPNPLRAQTVISYTLPVAGPVTLDVYDVRGRHVRNLVNEVRPEGRSNVVWNGRQSNGASLPTGVYFYRLVAGDVKESRKIVLVR